MFRVFLLLTVVMTVSAASSVVTLSTKNFLETVNNPKDDKGWMVKFYAPWCGHCKKLAPTWDKLAKAGEDNFGVGSLDCTTSQPICTQYKVKGYPTLKFIKDSKMYAFQGARNLEALTEFATSTYENADSTDL